jgi:hypothetical protein
MRTDRGKSIRPRCSLASCIDWARLWEFLMVTAKRGTSSIALQRGEKPLQKKKRLRRGQLALRLQRNAHERAAEEARRIPWQVLLEARNQYLDWQEFYYWARSIMQSEHGIPEVLARKLDELCPGFLGAENEYVAKHPKEASLAPIRLGQWIDERIFGFAEKGGWLSAITFYAVREPRYQKASACWSESAQRWQRARPIQYPAFGEWRRSAAECDETARLLPRVRKERACFKLVDPERLAETVSRFMDWEAFAYWARPAFETSASLPSEVAREVDSRCPGFMEFNAKERRTDKRLPRDWHRLMIWIGEHFFEDAHAEGWYEAILISATNHPRAIRTMEYFDRCDEIWTELPVPYPSFEAWRGDADRYVETAP